MTKKKPKAASDLVMVAVRLAPEDHARLRVVASKVGKSMAEFAREVVLREVRKAEAKS